MLRDSARAELRAARHFPKHRPSKNRHEWHGNQPIFVEFGKRSYRCVSAHGQLIPGAMLSLSEITTETTRPAHARCEAPLCALCGEKRPHPVPFRTVTVRAVWRGLKVRMGTGSRESRRRGGRRTGIDGCPGSRDFSDKSAVRRLFRMRRTAAFGMTHA